MTFTPEQIERAARLDNVGGAAYTALEAELLAEIGQYELTWLRRDPRVAAAADKIERQREKPRPQPVQTQKAAQEAEPETDGAMPELLPFSKLPGYLLDAWGVPHRQVGQGRKLGKVKLENYFYRREGEKTARHIARYRLSVDHKQKPFYPRYLMRARLHAEKEWREKLDLRNSKKQEVSPAFDAD